VAAAVAAGARDLGENRVQEAAAKKPGVARARWHLIGPLQRNKAKLALEVFDVIHTVDRPEIADRLQLLLAEHWPQRAAESCSRSTSATRSRRPGPSRPKRESCSTMRSAATASRCAD
jgi:uncharacterized pyridoxal phosphate-containing UPF0001 family protein